jgi:hypothetical protein
MRSGITFPVVADVMRSLFVDVAASELLTDTKSRTDSRISLLTGVHRKEIRRLRELPADGEAMTAVVTTSTEIIARWLGPGYGDEGGRPRSLPRMARTGAQSFDELVASVTTDVRPRAILDDWLSQGIVALDADDRVHLQAAAYIPRAGSDEQLFFFARNLHDHIAAAAANVAASGPIPFLDRSLHYDRLTQPAAVRLEAFAREAGMRVLQEANRLAQELVEGQAGTSATEPTQRINFGVYIYRQDEPPVSEPTA